MNPGSFFAELRRRNVYKVAVAYGVVGWLEKDYAERAAVLPDVTYWPNFNDVRSDPRYADLLPRIGLRP